MVRMIVSRLAVAGKCEWDRVRGLEPLALVCKAMQRMVDSHVTVLIEPEEVALGSHAAVKRRWPHAVKARLWSTQQAAQLLDGLPLLSELKVEKLQAAAEELGALTAFTQLSYLELKRPPGVYY